MTTLDSAIARATSRARHGPPPIREGAHQHRTALRAARGAYTVPFAGRYRRACCTDSHSGPPTVCVHARGSPKARQRRGWQRSPPAAAAFTARANRQHTGQDLMQGAHVFTIAPVRHARSRQASGVAAP